MEAEAQVRTSLAPRRRTRLQFGLRTLLVVTTVFAVWLGLTMARVRKERSAVKALQAAGASILYNYQSTGDRSWARTAQPQGPKWVRAILGGEYYDRPIFVSVQADAAGRDWIDAVNALTSVKTLYVYDATDDVVKRIKSPALEELHFSGSSINARGLESLAQLPNLRRLDLWNCAINDAAIPWLVKMPKLRYLSASGTQISAEGLGELQRQRSHLTVEHHQRVRYLYDPRNRAPAVGSLFG
jgi:hypothetical protein